MDPLSVIALAGQLVDWTMKAGSILNFVCSLKNVPGDMQVVRNDISSLLTLLKSVQRLIQDTEKLADYFTTGPFEAAMRAIKELLELLGGDFTDHLPRMMRMWQNMKWQLMGEKLKEIRCEIERQKVSINLSLATALLAVVASQASNTETVSVAIIELNNRLDHMEKTDILKHCLPQNKEISELHKHRTSLQEPETCNWISRERSFRDWIQPRNRFGGLRFVWIYGIPGAGKTVLASSIIERAANNCNSCGYAYYYCLYSRKQDETIPFLKHTLRMLCKQKQNMVLPKFQEAHAREEALSLEDLLDCLEEVSLAHENGVHVIIDAVDESKPRENLLRVLRQIGTEDRFWKVSLLFTSREESDIVECINECTEERRNAVARISMSNQNVRDDIKRYIHAQLSSDRFFRTYYEPSLIEEIEERLTHLAKGMFRWAVCQLDVLKRTRHREGVQKALQTLPGDIYATYERILTEIPPGDQEFAKTALALICSGTAEIPSAEVLVKASLWSVPFNEINRYTVATLKESCGSLISLTNLNRAPKSYFPRGDEGIQTFHRCSLAHYTVKEYLFSPNVATGPAQFFALSDKVISNIDLKVIFAGLGHLGLLKNTGQVGRRQAVLSRYEEYCLKMTQYALNHRRANIMRDEDTRKVIIKSLTPGSQHFKHLNGTHRPVNRTIMASNFQNWHMLCSLDPAFREGSTSGLLVNLAALSWRDLAVKYLESADFKDLSREQKTRIWTETFSLNDGKTETVLGYCLRECQLNFLRVFVRHGASFQHEPEALYTAMRAFDEHPDKALEALKFLFSAGAQPNPVPSVPRSKDNEAMSLSFVFTPLQLAVSELAYDWIDLLLDEGADANKIGKPDGIIPSSFDNTNYDNILALQELGQQTALEICSLTQPSWIRGNPSDIDSIRESIRVLLKRYGAEEPHGEIEDTSMTDIFHNQNGSQSDPVDLTFDDATGHQIN